MREVTLTWEEASLAKTDLVELTRRGGWLDLRRQPPHYTRGCPPSRSPSYKEGKTADDLDQIPMWKLNNIWMTVMARARGLEHPSARMLGGKIHEHPRHVTTILEKGNCI